MRHALTLFLLLGLAVECGAQSLYLDRGQRGVEVSSGWSVGPSSNGIETFASIGFDGRVDVGMGGSRYTLTFDDGSKSSFREYAPFVRTFVVKETAGGAPVSLAVSGQVFIDDFNSDDSGHYVQIGTMVFKNLKLSRGWAMQPFAGFAFVAESYTFGGGDADRAQYLTRDFGLHFTTAMDRPWVLRLTVAEQSFRRETYRGARLAVIRRL